MQTPLQGQEILAWFGLLAIPLIAIVFLASRRRAFPTRKLAWLVFLPVILSTGLVAAAPWIATNSMSNLFVVPLTTGAMILLLLADAALLLMFAVDLGLIASPANLQVERDIARIQSLGKKTTVTLRLANLGQRTLSIDLKDDVPLEAESVPNKLQLKLPGLSRATLRYTLRSTMRGRYTFEYVYMTIGSPGGLWRAYHRYPLAQETQVYPNLQQLREYALLSRTNRLSLMGLRKARRVGQDHDFERLRDFTRDDNYKLIDWRSTARRQRLIVKDFQATRSQRLMLMLDCGRMMTNESAGQTLFDHSINANLMLAHVALSQGDAVGMLVFSDGVHSYVPPRSGMGQMNRFLHVLFDRFPQMVESRYDEAFLYLSSHCRRRSLVVLTSNIIDEINGNQIQAYLASLAGKHLPLGVLLRDRRIFQHLADPHPVGQELYLAAAAADIVHWRLQVLASLRRKGVLMLDVFPEQITAPLINQYLEVKARHLL
ncbi:MAG: DUF58 domain-containing protein [Planctomycetota bacterium]|nr:DUF58 domain-containing protein [Planctomycetota bacterium]